MQNKIEPIANVTGTVVRQGTIIIDFLAKISNKLLGHKAIHIYMSKLQKETIKDYHRRMIHETFSPFVSERKGHLFAMNNDDIVIVYLDDYEDEIYSGLVKLKFLFADDPLLESIHSPKDESFSKNYDLYREMNEFRKLIKDMTQYKTNKNDIIEEEVKEFSIKREIASEQQKPTNIKKPFTPDVLAKVERALSGADFASMIRRQSICAMIGKAQPQMIFDEVFVSIGDLRDMVLPDVDISTSPWLFQHMTETLDKRVLANINKHDDGSLNKDFSINLNISTILSEEFLQFDDNINSSMKPSIVIELQLVDILSDLKSFNWAKSFAQERGYKICIDGVTFDKISYFDRKKLGVDLVKIFWQPQIIEAVKNNTIFQDHISKIGKSRVILCRVDDEQAVEIGDMLGVNLYQGRYVQKELLEDPRRRRLNL